MMFTNIRSIVFVLLITFCVCPKLSFGFDSKQILPDPDCGAKCLYVIFLELGVAPRSYKDFAKELGPAGKEGYSLLQLQNAARSRGLFAESCQLDHKDLGLFGKDPAAILHIVPGHFVILGSYLNNRLIIYDAATGIVSTESAGFLEKWSGRTLLISRNEIKLPTSSPKPILRWWWGLLGIVFVCSLVFSRRYWLNRRFGVFMIAIIPCLAGCETRIIEQAERAIANTEDTSAAAFSISPKVSIEKTVIDAGRLNLTRAPQVLSVPIHNQESTAIEISDVRISCNCLSGRISSKVIEPYGSATLELLLERSKAGPKNAMCTIMCGGHSVSTISVSWIVTADLAMTPDSIADLELGAGQKKEVAIEIDVYDKQNKPSIDVEYKWNLKNNMLLLGGRSEHANG